METIQVAADIVKSKTRQIRNLGNGKFEIHMPLNRQEELTINSSIYEDACLVITIDKEQLKSWRN